MNAALHLPTLIVISITLNLMVGALMWLAYRMRRRQTWFRTWASACLTFTAGSALASASAFMDFPLATVLIAHLLLGFAVFLVLAGINQLVGLPLTGGSLSSRLWIVTAAVYTIGLALTYSSQTDIPRLLTAAISAMVFSLCVYRLSTANRKPDLPSRLLRGLFTVHGILMMIQVLSISVSLVIAGIPVDGILSAVLTFHLLLTTATAITLPLLAFTRSERKLQKLADQDELTRLYNRRAFYARGKHLLEQAKQRGDSLTVMMLDLDHFKRINDRWGHAVGDDALKLVATVLTEELREADAAGRLGGEEFGIVLATGRRTEVEAIANRLLRRLVERGRVVGGHHLNISASIGGVAMNSQTDTLDSLIRDADRALYRAKRNGRNRAEFDRLVSARL